MGSAAAAAGGGGGVGMGLEGEAGSPAFSLQAKSAVVTTAININLRTGRIPFWVECCERKQKKTGLFF